MTEKIYPEVPSSEGVTITPIRTVTRQLLKLSDGDRIICRLDGPVQTRMITARGGHGESKLVTIPVTSYPGDASWDLICQSMLASVMEREADQVGKWYIIRRTETDLDTKAARFVVEEIEDPRPRP